LRDVLLEGVPVQWNKKCIKYVETQEGVWVFFEDGSQEFCNILVGTDGINSPIRKQKLPKLQIVDYGIIKVDDNDPASVIEHVKLIRTLRPHCELTDLLIELMMRDIDPMSIKSWTSSRVVLLGDAVHVMSPILGLGANNAIQDADKLSQALLKYTDSNISFIEEYEKKC
ncbi:FAD/NAD(P)-binding domain-containing protein, partial [Rhizophagus irregularis]